jgi:hypothetical protein
MSINNLSKELTKSINIYLKEIGLTKETERRMITAQETILKRERHDKKEIRFDTTSAECRRKLFKYRQEIQK